MDLKKYVANVKDFPKEGILFRDITPLLKDEKAFEFAVKEMSKPFKEEKIDIVVGIEARGLILAAPIAFYIGAGFVPIRKPGKLPWKTQRKEYELEYGMAILEIHEDAINKNDRVLIVDDVLATGGTAKAAADLVEQLGGEVVGFDFLIELIDFKAKEILKKYTLFSLLKL